MEPVPVVQIDGLLQSLAEETLQRGADAMFEVDGSSMLTLVRPRDVVRLRAHAAEELRLGDVVAARRPGGGQMVVHRVVMREGGKLVIRGDNCRSADGVFGPDEVIGVVTRVERGGRPVWFGAGRLGAVVAIAVRHGMVWRANRLYYGLRRHAGRALKFLGADSRLPGQKGDDGNE